MLWRLKADCPVGTAEHPVLYEDPTGVNHTSMYISVSVMVATSFHPQQLSYLFCYFSKH